MNTDAADGYVKIGAFIDPTGATAGADQVVQDVDRIEGATGKMDEAGAKAAQTLGSLRNAHHALMGIMELAQGGQAAVGGLAMEGRVATEVFEGMLGPLAPVLMIITTLTALAIPMIEKWEQQRSKIVETKDNTQDLTDATDAYKKKIDAVLEAQGQIEASDQRQLAILKEKQGLANKDVELAKDAEIEKARAEYLRKNGEATTDEERKRLLAQFEATKADITAGAGVHVAQNEVTFKGQDIAAAKKELADAQAAKATAQQQLSDAQDAAQAGQDYLATQGVGIGQDLLPKKDALKAATDAADKKIADAQAAKGEAAASGVDLTMTPMFDQNIAAATDQRDKLIAAAAAMNAYPDALTTLTKSIQDQSTKIDEDQAKLDGLQTELTQAQQALITATKNLADDLTERAQNEAVQTEAENLKKYQKQRDEELAGRLDAAETALKAKPDDKATENLIASLKIQGIQNKQWDAVAEGNKDKGFFDLTNQQITDIRAQTTTQETNQAAKETSKTDKTDERQVGDQAEALIMELGPSKQQAQAAHAAVQELDKGNAAGAAQLEQILSQLLGTAQKAGQSQQATFKSIFDALSKLDQTLSQQGNALASLRNNHQS